MAEFSKLVITNKGQALIAKMIAGEGNIDFTKISTSSTQYQLSQLEALTALTGVKQTSLISKVTRTNDVAIKVEAAFTNTDLTAGYYMRTLGLYAVDPDEGEILYAVTIETSGNCYMPPYNGVTVSGAYVQLVTTVGNADSVSLEVDQAAVATIGDIQELQKQISDLQAFVGYTDDDIFGVEVDFVNKKFTRLAAAVNRTPGEGFDDIPCFGGRKRCNVTDDGRVAATTVKRDFPPRASLHRQLTATRKMWKNLILPCSLQAVRLFRRWLNSQSFITRLFRCLWRIPQRDRSPGKYAIMFPPLQRQDSSFTRHSFPMADSLKRFILQPLKVAFGTLPQEREGLTFWMMHR